MNAQPIEARCDHCNKMRPLFLYRPDCDPSGEECSFDCPWCCVDRQPLLCPHCWSNRKLREEQPPQMISWRYINMRNRHEAARKAADRAVCDGIAKATERAEAKP